MGRVDLLGFNELQKTYKLRLYVKINPLDDGSFYFDYRANFDYFDLFSINLNELTNNLIDEFLLMKADYVKVYFHTLEFLSEKLNKHGIGICMGEDIESLCRSQLRRIDL